MTAFATGLSTAYGLRIRGNGEVLVANGANVVRFNSGGTSIQTYLGSSFTPPASQLFAFNLGPDGTTFWTGDIPSGYVYRINIATGAQVTSFATTPEVGGLYGVAVAGELTVAGPTATPTPQVGGPTSTPTRTPTATATATPTPLVIAETPTPIPMLDARALTFLAVCLVAVGLLLAKRLMR
jgi:hypothetical protein